MSQDIQTRMLDTMKFRCIGPPRGGRVVAVAGCPVNPAVFYFGAVAGGVYKTEDAGTSWCNVSDGFFETSSVGALCVAPSDANVIYAGMGESTIRLDVSPGNGVYRSTDGGHRWQHMGLTQTRHIGEIRVHPKNPDLVYVAALGNAFGHNEERGVYRSTDGGVNFERVLYVSDESGAIDLSMDTNNPDILYASIWQAHRNFWELSSGGPQSGLYKSVDGGDSWTNITRNEGLPAKGILGKIGVSASAAKPGRVFALIESDTAPGLYRSEDFGSTWALATDKQDLRYRPWYYMHVFADPVDEDTVYVTNLNMWKSTDGGATFTHLSTPHGDNHDLWIDPCDNRRMVQGNDGGANVSFNRGASWSTIYNQLTAQFYTVTTDNQQPHYRVYGTQQDNSSISVPSNSNDGAIVWADCYSAGTGESGFMAVHPRNANIVYVGAVGSSPGGGGALQRYDHSTGQVQLINVWPEAHGGMGAGELKYRFRWTFPVLFSPHDEQVIYTTGNVVFKSTDEGHSWQPISPDITRNFKEKLGASGGPITKDTSGAEHYCTVSTFRESIHEAGVFWAGSDDGLVHVSRDQGETWRDVTPPDLPEWCFIRTVEPCPHDAATVYVAATRYKLDDPVPYLFKSSDYGETWSNIVGTGIKIDDFVRVIRADPGEPGVLYVGTETSLYVSIDDGVKWQRWQSNFPVTPVYDLQVKDTDLVIGTHGRSFWILDDLTPLHQLARMQRESQRPQSAILFKPRSTWRLLPDIFDEISGTDGKDYAIGLGKAAQYIASRNEQEVLEREFLDAGQAAPSGALIYYELPKSVSADTECRLEIVDQNESSVRVYHPKPVDFAQQSDERKACNPGPFMPVDAGINRFVWDARHDSVQRLLGNKTAGEANRGPLAIPGTYLVRLVIGNDMQEQSFELVNDARSPATIDELTQQHVLLLKIRDKLSETYISLQQLRDIRVQLQTWESRLSGNADLNTLSNNVNKTVERLNAIESALILPGEHIDLFGLHDRVRLNAALSSVIPVIDSADAKPTQQAAELAEHYMVQIDEQLVALSQVVQSDIIKLNTSIQEANLPAIHIPGR